MVPIISLLIIIMLSIVITRFATIALVHTGLSREAARFQARSAFTGSGFTTKESEQVVNHPVRRRIVLFLMLLGHAGIVTVISSLILTFIDYSDSHQPGYVKAGILLSGVLLLWLMSSSQFIDKNLSKVIDIALRKYTKLEVKDYASLLHLAGEYRLAEVFIEEDDWLEKKSLNEAELWKEGIRVLGIRRNEGTYLGTPDGETVVHAKDCVIAYGRVSSLEELDGRKKSYVANTKHIKAIKANEMVKEEEKKKDEEVAEEHED